jgi:hypothetical protein
VPVSQLRHCLLAAGLTIEVMVEAGADDEWDQIIVRHPDGEEITAVERNRVESGQLGAAEIAELIDGLEGTRPVSAAAWLRQYLPMVKAIYAFQVLQGADVGDGWKAIDALLDELWGAAGGIVQADGEGFSNLSGYHILWQFSDDVQGPWNMAVLDDEGQWVPFQMELGNKRQRKAFLAGKVPPTAKRL